MTYPSHFAFLLQPLFTPALLPRLQALHATQQVQRRCLAACRRLVRRGWWSLICGPQGGPSRGRITLQPSQRRRHLCLSYIYARVASSRCACGTRRGPHKLRLLPRGRPAAAPCWLLAHPEIIVQDECCSNCILLTAHTPPPRCGAHTKSLEMALSLLAGAELIHQPHAHAVTSHAVCQALREEAAALCLLCNDELASDGVKLAGAPNYKLLRSDAARTE